jgi:hypothetical protein
VPDWSLALPCNVSITLGLSFLLGNRPVARENFLKLLESPLPLSLEKSSQWMRGYRVSSTGRVSRSSVLHWPEGPVAHPCR